MPAIVSTLAFTTWLSWLAGALFLISLPLSLRAAQRHNYRVAIGWSALAIIGIGSAISLSVWQTKENFTNATQQHAGYLFGSAAQSMTLTASWQLPPTSPPTDDRSGEVLSRFALPAELIATIIETKGFASLPPSTQAPGAEWQPTPIASQQNPLSHHWTNPQAQALSPEIDQAIRECNHQLTRPGNHYHLSSDSPPTLWLIDLHSHSLWQLLPASDAQAPLPLNCISFQP